MPKFKIHHITKYTYEGPVRDSANQVLLFPVKDEYQELQKQEIVISGEPMLDIYKDYYGNEVGSFMQADPHTMLIIDSQVEVITRARPEPVDTIPKEEQWSLLQQIRWQVPYIDFLKQEHFDHMSELQTAAGLSAAHSLSPLEAAHRLNGYVYEGFKYIKGVTSVETTLDEIWKLQAGVCQDFAHILLALLRQIGIPARYVSGYICSNKDDVRGEGATHAWIEAYIPLNGWIGFDPTNNTLVTDQHVRLAVGRNFSDCSPVKGIYKGSPDHILEVGVSVAYEGDLPAGGPGEPATVLMPQPVKNGQDVNSYRRYMEMMQQQ